MKRKTLILVLILLIPVFLDASYYFRDDFTTLDATKWYTNDLNIGREGYLGLTNNNATGFSINPAGELYIDGAPTADGNFSGCWNSEITLMTQQTFSASETIPFGFEVLNTYFYFILAGSAGNIEREVTQDIWLVQHTRSDYEYYKTTGRNFENFLLFFHKRSDLIDNTPSYMGAFLNGIERNFDLTKATRADGITKTNISQRIEGFTEEDRTSNTNIGIRITHDGSKVTFYINPNPYNLNDFPNEFCKVYEGYVTWNDNMNFGMGMHSRSGQGSGGRWDARYDYAFVRSAAASSKTWISPTQIATSSNSSDRTNYTVTIQNVLGSTNAGFNIVNVTKPSSWSSWVETVLTNDILVLTDYDNDDDMETNISRSFSAHTSLGNNEAAIETNGDQLWIRLGTQIKPGAGSKNVEIKFRMATKTNAIIGDKFTFYSTVEAVLFEDMTDKSNYSTCGPQQGSGLNNVVTINDANLNPDAFASITPNIIYSDQDNNSFVYRLDTAYITNGSDLIRLEINIPDGITVVPSSVDSSVLIDDSNITVSTTLKKIIVDYSGESVKISGADGIDFIFFNTTTLPTTNYGIWTSTVFDANGKSAVTRTNFRNESQRIDVFPASPKGQGQLFLDDTVNIVYWPVKTNEIKYKIDNSSGELGNNIKAIRIYVPELLTFFTNSLGITNIKSDVLDDDISNIVVNSNCIEVIYSNEGKTLLGAPTAGKDIITFTSIHNESSKTQAAFSSSVNNGNGQDFLAANIIVNNMLYINDPKVTAQADISPMVVYTSDITNDYTYKIKNIGLPGFDIETVRIDINTNYFTTVKILSNSWWQYSEYVTNIPGTIFIKYFTSTNTNLLVSGAIDNIYLRMADKITTDPNSHELKSHVINGLETNETIDSSLSERNDVSWKYQEPRVVSYVSNNEILSEITTSTVYYHLENQGDPGNLVQLARLYFDSGSITSITKATSLNEGFNATWGGGVVDLNYATEGKDFDGGEKDIIMIIWNDNVISEDSFNFLSRVTVNTSVLEFTDVKPGETNLVKFLTPPPDVDAYINPNIMFTRNTSTTNYFTLMIHNDGLGNNELYEVRINIPPILTNVTATTSTWMGGATYINNLPSQIVLQYSNYGTYLAAQSNDTVILRVIGNVNIGTITNAYFSYTAKNNDQKGFVSGYEMSGKSLDVSIVDQPTINITPNTNFTTDETNTYRVKLINGTIPGKGRNIYRARITINTQIFGTNYINSYDHYSAAVTKNSNEGGILYRFIDYSANLLIPSNVDDFSMVLVDKVLLSNTITWLIEVDYNDGYGFRSTIPQSANSDKLSFTIPPVEGNAYITPNEIAAGNTLTPFEYIINNNGLPGNEILIIRINIPNPDTIFTNVEISSVSNDAGVSTNNITFSTAGGNGHISQIIINYGAEGTNIPAGGSDKIYFSVYDSVLNAGSTKYPFTCDAANTIDSNFSALTTVIGLPEAVLDAQKVKFSDANYDSYAYVLSPESIDTTTTTNTIKYFIYNSSLTSSDRINRIQISIPTNYFITNGIQVSSATNPVITVGANLISIDYASLLIPIEKGANDTIIIKIQDKLTSGSVSNIAFPIKALFSTSIPNYIPCDEPGGEQLQSIDFIMPDAVADGYINPDYILPDNGISTFTYNVTNKGLGSNKIKKVVINFISSILTNLKAFNVQSTLIATANSLNMQPAGIHTNEWSQAVNTSSITLDYSQAGTELDVGAKDVIKFSIIDNFISETNIDNAINFNIYFANSSASNAIFHAANLTPSSLLPKSADLKQLPFDAHSASVEAGFAEADNTYNTNNPITDITYTIKNFAPYNVPANNIAKAILSFSNTTITNYNISSFRIVDEMNNIKKGEVSNISMVTLYYGRDGNEIVPGDRDDIYLEIYHNRDISKPTKTVNFICQYIFQTNNGTMVSASGLWNGFNAYDPGSQGLPIRASGGTASGYISEIVKYINGLPVPYISKTNTPVNLYTMDNRADIIYKIDVGSSRNICRFRIDINTNIFKVLSAPYSMILRSTNHSEVNSNYVRINYDLSTNLTLKSSDDGDIIKIPVSYNLSTASKYTLGSMVSIEADGGGCESTYRVVPVNKLYTQIIDVEVANFGRIVGKVYPPDLTVSKQVFDSNDEEVKTVFNNSIPEVYTATNGIYVLDYIPSGTYNVKHSAGNLAAIAKSIPVSIGSNINYIVEDKLDIDLKYLVQKEKQSGQNVRCYDEGYTNSVLLIPSGSSVLEGFYFNIRTGNFNQLQKQALSGDNSCIKSTSVIAASNLVTFNFDIEDLNGNNYDAGIELSSECILRLKVDPATFPPNWNAGSDELAIYYWDELSKKWYRVGGTYDSVNNIISANVMHLNRTYAVLATSCEQSDINVVVDNNPFTPGAGNPEYNRAIINFQLKDEVDKVEIIILNPIGERVREFKLDVAGYKSGQQAWDGNDSDGYPVKSGIYYFQIIAGENDYFGSILVVK